MAVRVMGQRGRKSEGVLATGRLELKFTGNAREDRRADSVALSCRRRLCNRRRSDRICETGGNDRPGLPPDDAHLTP